MAGSPLIGGWGREARLWARRVSEEGARSGHRRWLFLNLGGESLQSFRDGLEGFCDLSYVLLVGA